MTLEKHGVERFPIYGGDWPENGTLPVWDNQNSLGSGGLQMPAHRDDVVDWGADPQGLARPVLGESVDPCRALRGERAEEDLAFLVRAGGEDVQGEPGAHQNLRNRQAASRRGYVL